MLRRVDSKLLFFFILFFIFLRLSLTATPSEVDALEDLYFSTNGKYWIQNDNWLNGEDPCYSNWFGIFCNTDLNVIEIILPSNNVTGILSASMDQLFSLENLVLPDNYISGTIPSALGYIDSFYELSLYSNKLESTIPASFKALSNLQYLFLSSNNLSGSIDVVTYLTSLRSLELSNNNFESTLPSTLSNLQNLSQLLLSNNNFYSTIPDTLFTLSNLIELELDNNSFQGELPNIYNYKLNHLTITNNNLVGTVPDFIQDIGSYNISNNKFDCPIKEWCIKELCDPCGIIGSQCDLNYGHFCKIGKCSPFNYLCGGAYGTCNNNTDCISGICNSGICY